MLFRFSILDIPCVAALGNRPQINLYFPRRWLEEQPEDSHFSLRLARSGRGQEVLRLYRFPGYLRRSWWFSGDVVHDLTDQELTITIFLPPRKRFNRVILLHRKNRLSLFFRTASYNLYDHYLQGCAEEATVIFLEFVLRGPDIDRTRRKTIKRNWSLVSSCLEKPAGDIPVQSSSLIGGRETFYPFPRATRDRLLRKGDLLEEEEDPLRYFRNCPSVEKTFLTYLCARAYQEETVKDILGNIPWFPNLLEVYELIGRPKPRKSDFSENIKTRLYSFYPGVAERYGTLWELV